MDVYTLLGSLANECADSSFVEKTCSVGQMRFPSTAMTNTAHAQMNQIMRFSASFSRHACCTSNRFMRPNHFRNGVGTHHVRSQHSATHRRRADVSLTTSVVSPSWISPGSASFSRSAFLSAFWNMLRDGAYDSVAIDAVSSWLLVSLLRASKSSLRSDRRSS